MDIEAVLCHNTLLLNLRGLWISMSDESIDRRKGTVTLARLRKHGDNAHPQVQRCATPAELKQGQNDFVPAVHGDGQPRTQILW